MKNGDKCYSRKTNEITWGRNLPVNKNCLSSVAPPVMGLKNKLDLRPEKLPQLRVFEN